MRVARECQERRCSSERQIPRELDDRPPPTSKETFAWSASNRRSTQYPRLRPHIRRPVPRIHSHRPTTASATRCESRWFAAELLPELLRTQSESRSSQFVCAQQWFATREARAQSWRRI